MMEAGKPALKLRRVGGDINQPVRKVTATDSSSRVIHKTQQQQRSSSESQNKKASLTRQTLCRFIHLTFSKNKKANYQRLISELDFSAKFKPESAKQWYGALTECVSVLKYGSLTGPSSAATSELWRTIFDKFRWDFPLDALSVYVGFLRELVNRHPSALRRVISYSVQCLRQVSMSAVTASVLRKFPIDSALLSTDHTSAESWNSRVALIHQLLRDLYQLRPTLSSLLFQELVDCFPKPYSASGGIEALIGAAIPPSITPHSGDSDDCSDEFKLPTLLEGLVAQGAPGVAEFIRLGRAADEWVCYTQQLFAIIHYMPELRDKIIQLLIERLILLDMTAQKKRESQSDIQTVSDCSLLSVSEKMLRSMDEVMLVFFEYIQIISKHESQLSCVFRSLLRTFESCILTSVEVSHVPFILFYISHCKMKFGDEFISRLLSLIQDVSISTFERCSAVAYLAAFVTKAEFVSVSITIAEDSHSRSDDSSSLSSIVSSNCNISVTISEARQHVLFYAVCQALFKILIAKQNNFDEHFDQHHYYDDYPSSSMVAANSDCEDSTSVRDDDDDGEDEDEAEEECLMGRRHKWEQTPQKKQRKMKRVSYLRRHMCSVINSPLSPLRFMNSQLISQVIRSLNDSILFGSDSNRNLTELQSNLLKHQCVDWQSFGGTFVKLQSEPFKQYNLPKSKKRLDCLFTLRKSSVIGDNSDSDGNSEESGMRMTQDALDNASVVMSGADHDSDDDDDNDDESVAHLNGNAVKNDSLSNNTVSKGNRKKRKLSDARGTDSNDSFASESDCSDTSSDSSNSSSVANHADMMALVESRVNPKHALTPSLASVDAETESVMRNNQESNITESGSDPPMLDLGGGMAADVHPNEDSDDDDSDGSSSSSSSSSNNDFSLLLTKSPKI